MKKQPLTKKGVFLGMVLLAMAVLSTVLIFSLRPEKKTEAEATTEKAFP